MFYFYEMKKALLLFSVFTLIFSCKKDEKITESTTLHDNFPINTPDSAKVDSATIIPSDNQSLKVNPLNESADLGKVIFTQDDQVVIAFNTRSQTGKIMINDKEYALNKLIFTENNYEISGSGIKISAEEGNFREMVTDCVYGNFPQVKITLNQQEISLENVNVQDCPAY